MIKNPFSLPYKKYTALVTVNNPPTVIVFENDLSAPITWTYSDAGIIYGTLAGEFTADKTFVFVGGGFSDPTVFDFVAVLGFWIDNDKIGVSSLFFTGAIPTISGYDSNTKYSIEIRIYP